MLNSIFTSTLDFKTLLICFISAIFLGCIISITHKYTSKYNKNFLITIIILPLLVCSVIMMVNGNLGTSIAVMGAFSLVRFRSMPGTSKEIITIFFAMAVGLALGMGQIIFSFTLTLIGCLLFIILNKINFFDINKKEKILKILISENLDYEEVFDDIFSKYLKEYSLNKVKTVNMGSMFELQYNIVLKNNVSEKEFIDEIRIRNGNLKISLSHSIIDCDL